MPKFPTPPGVSALKKLGIKSAERKVIPAGTVIWRLYFQGGPHPTAWHDFRCYGPTNSRFDHHAPPPRVQERGIFYAAQFGPVCITEVFQSTRTVNRSRRNPWLVAFELTRKVHILDMSGAWPTRAKASQAINTGPRPRARKWSQQIYEAFSNIEGIYYPSSMYKGKPAIALYERAGSAIPKTPKFHRALDDPALLPLLQKVALEIGYRLI